MRLPGLCIVCRLPVVWNGKYWRSAEYSHRRHVCDEERPVCGSWMPNAKERCARGPGHVAGAHKTAYALENDARMRGCERARARYNTGVGTSDESNRIANGARVSASTSDAGVVAHIEVLAR